jgi:hypothetical protein
MWFIESGPYRKKAEIFLCSENRQRSKGVENHDDVPFNPVPLALFMDFLFHWSGLASTTEHRHLDRHGKVTMAGPFYL